MVKEAARSGYILFTHFKEYHFNPSIFEEKTMSANPLNRRAFLKGASLSTAGLLLAACAPAAATQPAATAVPAAEATATAVPEKPAEPTKPPVPEVSSDAITYWTCWGGIYTNKAFGIIQESQEFKDQLKGQKFEIKGGLTMDAFLTAVAGGTPPDGCSNVNYTDFVSRDVVVPIDALAATSSIVKKDLFLPSYWDLGFYAGKMFGVPANECFSRYGLYYNTKLVEEAGLDPAKPPETWDEVLVWHAKLTSKDAAGNVKSIGLDPIDAEAESIWDMDGWMPGTSWGFQVYDPNAKKFNVDNAQFIDYLATTKKFMDQVGMDNLASLRSVQGNGTWGGSYENSVQAMIINGYWFAGECANAKPEVSQYNKATWLPVPASRKGTRVQSNAGHIVLFLKGAKHLEGMFKVAEFLNTKIACDAIFNSTGWLPATKSYVESVDPKKYPGLDFFLGSVDQVTEWVPAFKCPIVSYFGDNFTQLREKVYRDQMKPQEAATELQRRASEELKNQGFA